VQAFSAGEHSRGVGESYWQRRSHFQCQVKHNVFSRKERKSSGSNKDVSHKTSRYSAENSRWREIWVCNANTCGESKSQNSHKSLLDLTCLIAATAPKTPIY
jgi:hypothetical protein